MSQDCTFKGLVEEYLQACSEAVRAEQTKKAASRNYHRVRELNQPQLFRLRGRLKGEEADLYSETIVRNPSREHIERLRAKVAATRRDIRKIDNKIDRASRQSGQRSGEYHKANRKVRQAVEALKQAAMNLAGASGKAHLAVKSGRVDLYFGGEDHPLGDGHGHYVLSYEGQVRYGRDPKPAKSPGSSMTAPRLEDSSAKLRYA